MSAAVEAAAVKIQELLRGRLSRGNSLLDLPRRDSHTARHQYEALPDGALTLRGSGELREMEGGERMVAERRAYDESRSGEEKAAFGRMLENTMVSTRQPVSQPDSATTCTALTARWPYIPH